MHGEIPLAISLVLASFSMSGKPGTRFLRLAAMIGRPGTRTRPLSGLYAVQFMTHALSDF